MNNRFPVLSIISICLKALGWFAVIYGLYFFVYEGLIEPHLEGHSFSPQDRLQIIQGLSIFVSGLITAAVGEIIGVLFAIEENTRKNM